MWSMIKKKNYPFTAMEVFEVKLVFFSTGCCVTKAGEKPCKQPSLKSKSISVYL